MKKFLLAIIALTLFCGCTNNNMTNLDINGASKSLDNKYQNMQTMNKDELEVIYGLNLNEFEDYIIKSSSSANGDFYAIIKVKDENKKQVQDKMNDMFKVLENQSNLYSPEAVSKLKNRLSTSVGNYLIYIVSDDNNSFYEVVKGFIN